MAYCNGKIRTGKPEITKVFCDDCAENGEVPFDIVDEDGTKFQKWPWCWHPIYGEKCHKCGRNC